MEKKVTNYTALQTFSPADIQSLGKLYKQYFSFTLFFRSKR